MEPKFLSRSLAVMRKKRESFERTLEAKERRREKNREKGEKRESDHGGLDRHLIITERRP